MATRISARNKAKKWTSERPRIQEILRLIAVSQVLQDDPYLTKASGKVNVTNKCLDQLTAFCHLVLPKPHSSVSFSNQLFESSEYLLHYLDVDTSPVVGTTYSNLHRLVKCITDSDYFDNGKALNNNEAVNASDQIQQLNDAASDSTELIDPANAAIKPENTDDLKEQYANNQLAESEIDVTELSEPGEDSRCCMVCGKIFASFSALQTHHRVHTGYKPFSCPHCCRSFTQSGHVARHILRRHATDKPYVCAYCNKSYASVQFLQEHLRSHGVTESLVKRAGPHQCTECGRQFAQRQRLVRHMRVHSGDRPYMCAQCGLLFADPSHFSRHRRVHDTRLSVIHHCIECDRSFSSPELLRLHRRVHSDERPHICSRCGRAFRRTGDLRIHSRTHTGERPYVCQVCNASFTQWNSLRYHLRVHSGERPHSCSVCSHSFRSADKLRIHVRMHTGERPHACETCGRRFADKSAFRRHVRTHMRASINFTHSDSLLVEQTIGV